MDVSVPKLFTETYTYSILFTNAFMTPHEGFSLINTGNSDFDTFFHTFWEKTKRVNFVEEITLECAELTKKYPDFAYLEHVVGIYLYVDFNAFDFYLKEAALLYLLMCIAQRGEELNDTARSFIQTSVLVSYKSNPMSQSAFKLIEKYVETTEQPVDEVKKYDDLLLYPLSDSTPVILPSGLQEKINSTCSMMGMDCSADTYAYQIGWYESAIKKLSLIE